MLGVEEARQLNLDALTRWLRPQVRMQTQWGTITSREWVIRETTRLLELGYIVEAVQDKTTGQVAIFHEATPWRVRPKWRRPTPIYRQARDALKDSALDDGLSFSEWFDASGVPRTSFCRVRKYLFENGYVKNVGTTKRARYAPK